MLIIRARLLLKDLRYINIFILMLLFLSIVACSTKGIKQKGKLLAKVGETELYDSDLKICISDTADLKTVKERLVKDWVNHQLLFKKAMAGLSDREKDKDRQLKDYYESLIIFDYFNKMTSSAIDTNVSESEMNAYYQENKKNFVTTGNIIRLIYVKVPVAVKIDKKVRNWIVYPDQNSINGLQLYAKQYGATALLDTGKWYHTNEILADVPVLKDYLVHQPLRKKVLPELNDGKFRYGIDIIETRTTGEISPFELVKTQIRQIVLNRRKAQMIKDTENMIYREGDSRHLFEIFNDKIKK